MNLVIFPQRTGGTDPPSEALGKAPFLCPKAGEILDESTSCHSGHGSRGGLGGGVGCRWLTEAAGGVMVRVLSRGQPLRWTPECGPGTRLGALSLPPSGARGVRRVAGGERRATRFQCCPSPSLLCPSCCLPLFIPLFSLPCPALCCGHGQEGPCQRGPVSMSWQRQRLAAPAASTVSPGFLSGAEGRAGQPPPDGPLAGFGEERPWGAAPPSPSCLSPWGPHLTSMEVSCQSHGCAWMSRGESMAGRGAVPTDRCAPGRRPGRGCQTAVRPACVAPGACMDHACCFLALQECALRSGDASDACPLRELRLPAGRRQCLRNQRPPCWPRPAGLG